MERDISLTVRPTAAASLISYPPIVSKDNKYLMCCCGCDVKVFSVKSGKVVHILKGHHDIVTDVAFNPANQFQVFSSSMDGTIRKWNFEDGVLISVSTPTSTDEAVTNLVVYGMYSLSNDRKNFIYLVKTQNDASGQKGEYRFMKQAVFMERWSSSDFISKQFKEMPSNISIGGQGSFLAAITSSTEFEVINLARSNKSVKHRVSRDISQVDVQQCLARPTCLTAHPTEDCVAVGHADGKINVWTNVLSKKAIYSWVHWHALPVLSLQYTPEGSYLLSGGHESVLVKWPHTAYGNQGQREYLPRLGAPLSHITSSEDNSVYVTSHLDNSIKVVKNWIVIQVFQGLTRDYLSKRKSEFPAGVNFEPRSGALVINGLPGHLQFYSLSQDKLLYNLDIVGQNYTSGDSLNKQHNYTRIELVEFSADGSWMVTVERWTGSYSEQCRMKFWFYDTESNSYVLNTDVDTPHQGQVSTVRFSPPADDEDSQSVSLVSVGATDKKFKLWKINDSRTDNANKASASWRVESTGYYKNKTCSVADFSDDGSVLAVVFENTLTLWDPFENHLCTSIDMDSNISAVKFCHGAQANLLIVATVKNVVVWDLLSYSEKRRWSIPGCKILAVDPFSQTIAAFSNRKGFTFNCSGEFAEFSLPSYAKHISSIAFSTDKPSKTSSEESSSIRRRLYVGTKSGSILVVDDKEVSDCPDVTPTVEQASRTHIASNYQQVTPLANLLSSQLVKDLEVRQIDSRTGLAATQIIKQIGETSCVAMPSINTLCRAFLNSLLLDEVDDHFRKKADAESSDSETEMEVDSSEDESDIGNGKSKELISSTFSSSSQDLKLKKSNILDFSNSWQKT